MSSESLAAPRTVFFVSDGTAITAETLGSALLLSFPDVAVVRRTIPFINTETAARAAATTMSAAVDPQAPAIVFSTINDPSVRAVLVGPNLTVIDLLSSHLGVLERELGLAARTHPGTAHSRGDLDRYHARIRAVEYAMEHDDGQSVQALDHAEVILIAPSRCGKTPTSLYLAMQHGVVAANYPLTADDLPAETLPAPLRGLEHHCIGLTTTPQHLHQVREARRPNSPYASLAQCTRELRWAEALYRRLDIPFLSSADRSVEEMAAVILHTMERRVPAATTKGTS